MFKSNHLVKLVSVLIILALVPLALSCAPSTPAPAAKPAAPQSTSAVAPAAQPSPSPAAAKVDTIKLRIAHSMPPSTPGNLQTKDTEARLFKDLVEKRGAGRVTVEIYPSAQLYADPAALTALSNGELFMSMNGAAELTAWEQAFSIFNLPGIFTNTNQVDRWLKSDKGGKVLIANLEKKGLIMGWGPIEVGPQLFTKNKPVTKVSDVEGLRLRVGNDASQVAFVKAVFKTDAVQLSMSDVSMALSQGMLDGIIAHQLSVEPRGLHDVLRYCLEEPIMYAAIIGPIISKTALGKLPADLQKMLLDSMYEVCDQVRLTEYEELNGKSHNNMVKAGVTFTKMTPEEQKKFWELVKPVQDKYIPIIGKDLVDEANKLR